MADISVKDLENLNEALKDSALGAFISNLKEAGQSMTSFGELTGKVSESVVDKISKIINSTADLVQSLGGYKEVAERVQKAGTELWSQMTSGMSQYIEAQDFGAEGMVAAGTRMVLAMEPVIGLIPKGITGMGDLSDAGTSAGSKITDAFSNLSPTLTKVLGNDSGYYKLLETMAQGASNVYSLQHELGNLAAAQGRFSTVAETSTNYGKNLNEMYLNQVNLAYESAAATGHTVASMMDLSRAIGAIPDSLSENVNILGSMSQLAAVTQLATGYMRNNSEVAKLLGDMYTNMGVSGKEAYVNIANLYESAGDSKLRFESFTSTVMNMAGGFKMLGDNTVAATNIVKAFDDVFKTSDISPAAMSDLISRMGQGIEKMDLAKMSFVSGATGGPGGLAGGLQMELAIREGRMDEVLQKTMQAMQAQFGGQILTLEDAGQNEQLAAEFVKQREYLKQVAGIAGTDSEANRILEAMKSGVMDSLVLGRAEMDTDGSKNLENAIRRGESEQHRTTTELMKINQFLEGGVLIRNFDYAKLNEYKQLSSPLGDISGNRMMDASTASAKAASINTSANPSYVGIDESSFIKGKIDSLENGFIGSLISSVKDVASKGDSEVSNLIQNIRGSDPGIRNLSLPVDVMSRAPMRLEDYANAPFGLPEDTQGSNVQSFELSYQPLEVRVSFDEPFDQKVRLIADQQISRAQQGQVRAAANGRPR